MPRRGALYIAYETADRPLCALCPPVWRKRAVFFHVLRQRPVCAGHAVVMVKETILRSTTRVDRRLVRAGGG